MKIRDFVDVKALQEIQDQFSDSTGLAAITVDSDGKYVTEGSNFTEFCMKYTRGSKEGNRRCVKCDNECIGTYFCHAGLMDFASEILVNGEKVGAVIGGQVLPAPPDIEAFRAIARELGIPEEEYIRALNKVPIRSERMIRASASLLGNVVNQMVNQEYYKKLNQKKMNVFEKEVKVSLDAIKEVKSYTRDLQNVASMENILSINAAIEAGRAGQAGVGFAVVAREIGDLSKNSAHVYTEIQNRINEVERAIVNMNEVDL